MSSAPKRTVEVRIQGRAYRIRADGNADAVRRAAALLDETMERVRLRAGTVDSIDIAVLAALNIANSLVSERESGSGVALPDERIADLVELIEAAMAEPGMRSH